MKYIDPPNKLLKHIDRIADIMNETPVIPINVEIDLTNRCNLGCQGCHMAYLHSRGVHAKRRTHETGDIMDTELAISIVRQLAAVGVRSITWTGGGEPTLHPDIAEIIRYTLIPQGIYTNGVQVTPELASLLKIHMDWVYVSLDRHDRDGYMKYKAADKLFQSHRVRKGDFNCHRWRLRTLLYNKTCHLLQLISTNCHRCRFWNLSRQTVF